MTTATTPTTAVGFDGVSRRYGENLALDDVSLGIASGETVALLGANGSGKTTFVLQLNGTLRGEGSIEVCGLPVVKENLAAIRSKIGMVFQDSDEQLFMPTVLEDVAFGALNMGLGPDEAVHKAQHALEDVGLEYAASIREPLSRRFVFFGWRNTLRLDSHERQPWEDPGYSGDCDRLCI